MLDSTEDRLRKAWHALPAAAADVRRRSAERLLDELETRDRAGGNTARRRTAIGALAAACLAIGFFVGTATTAGPSNAATSALGFQPSAGWNVISNGAVPLRTGQAAVATNERFSKKDTPAGSFPQATLGHLPPDGVVIWVFALPRGQIRQVDAAFTPRKLPLRLDEARIFHAWETQPNPRVPEYRILAAIGNVNVDARVYFGTQTPSKQLRNLAQSELSRLLVPRRG